MASGTTAVTLMSQTRDPYQVAFEKQRGAHLQVAFRPNTDPQLIQGTAATIGASAYGGPYPASNIQFRFGDRKFYVDAVGRDNPGGAVEVLNITSGRWPVANDEIVLTRSFSELNKISVGDRLKVTSVAQTPTLTVVGEVVDIDEGSADLSSQRAWMLPAALPALSTPDSSFYLMDYRFPSDPTGPQLQTSLGLLKTSLPPGSVAGALTYLLIGSIFNITNQILTGMLKPIVAITKASAPRGSGGRVLRHAAARLRLPRPVVLGIGDAFARPLRAALTLITVLLGVATVVVAVGLPRSFELINNSETGAGNYQVVVTRSSAYPDSDVMRVLNAQPETARVVASGGQNVIVPGVGDPVNTRLFRGDSSRLGYMVVAGRWYSAPGEVVAPAALMHDAHLQIGDSFTGTANGQPLQLRLVGETYDINNLGHSLFMDIATMASVTPAVEPFLYDVTLAPGSDVSAYVRRVAAVEPDLLDVRASDTSTIAPVKIIDLVLLILAGVLALIGVGGVFNTVLLNTRERIHDTATLKALGMSPRQVIVMVGASAGLLALVGGLVAMPLGLSLHHVLNDVISNSAGNETPPVAYAVFNAYELVLIPLLGVGVAIAAALIPGRWAARTNVVEVLHAE